MTSEQQKGQMKEAKEFNENRMYKCPDCGGKTYYMGIDFKAPKKTDIKGWQKVEAFIRSGKIYWRGIR